MMRRLVKRHKGILPLDTAESIWRVIISTFTYVQAPFSVHADLSAGDALMRDSARFHFGFTVPFVAHMGASAVVAAVSTSKGDLGLVPAFAVAVGRRRGGARSNSTPRPRSSRACPSSSAPTIRPRCRCSCSHGSPPTPWRRKPPFGACACPAGAPGAAQALSALADFIAVPDRAFDGAALLITLPTGVTLEAISAALVKAGATVRSAALVGSHATRYTVGADKSLNGRNYRDDRHPTATAPRRARHRPLRAGQEQRRPASPRCSSCPPTRRRWGRARARSRPIARPASTWRIIRTARPRRCARRSATCSGSIRRASSAAPAPTICSICSRAPISPTATRRSTPRTAFWSIRSRRWRPAPSPWSRRRRISPPTSTPSSSW